MNNTIETLTSRKSCKSYKSEQIGALELEQILQAGIHAPSGRNMQSAIIVVIQDAETISKLSKINASILGIDGDPFYGAPTVIVVLALKSGSTPVEDGCLVMGNLLNAAYSVGVGGCWIHRARETFETDEGKKLLLKWGIKDEIIGVGNCILGYPKEPLHEDYPRKDDYIIRV